MALFEVDYSEKAGKWGVYDRDVPLTAESTKQAAKQFAKSQGTPGDTIQVFTKDHRLENEYIIGDDGELVSADAGNQGGGGMQGGGLFGAGQVNGGGGLFGGNGGGGLF